MIKACELCGREFVARRSTAKWCSDACKMRWHRGTVALPGSLEPATPRVCMSAEDVAAVIEDAHRAAQDLSRASMLTRQPLSGRLGSASAKIEAALRGEGL